MGNLGICFVNPAPEIEPGYVTAMARKCDQAGLHSFWTIDRIAYDNLEALTVLAAVAGATENIRLGTSVLLSALRHPALLAKTVATLDFLSNGRVTPRHRVRQPGERFQLRGGSLGAPGNPGPRSLSVS